MADEPVYQEEQGPGPSAQQSDRVVKALDEGHVQSCASVCLAMCVLRSQNTTCK